MSRRSYLYKLRQSCAGNTAFTRSQTHCMPSMPSWDFFTNKFPTPVKTGRRRSREVPIYYSERMYQELAPMDIKLLTFIPLNHACRHGKFVGGIIWNVYRKFLKHLLTEEERSGRTHRQTEQYARCLHIKSACISTFQQAIPNLINACVDKVLLLTKSSVYGC